MREEVLDSSESQCVRSHAPSGKFHTAMLLPNNGFLQMVFTYPISLVFADICITPRSIFATDLALGIVSCTPNHQYRLGGSRSYCEFV